MASLIYIVVLVQGVLTLKGRIPKLCYTSAPQNGEAFDMTCAFQRKWINYVQWKRDNLDLIRCSALSVRQPRCTIVNGYNATVNSTSSKINIHSLQILRDISWSCGDEIDSSETVFLNILKRSNLTVNVKVNVFKEPVSLLAQVNCSNPAYEIACYYRHGQETHKFSNAVTKYATCNQSLLTSTTTTVELKHYFSKLRGSIFVNCKATVPEMGRMIQESHNTSLDIFPNLVCKEICIGFSIASGVAFLAFIGLLIAYFHKRNTWPIIIALLVSLVILGIGVLGATFSLTSSITGIVVSIHVFMACTAVAFGLLYMRRQER